MKLHYLIVFIVLFTSTVHSQSNNSERPRDPIKELLFNAEQERENKKKEQAERLNRLWPENLSESFKPNFHQFQIDELMVNGDTFISSRLREEYGKVSKQKFEEYIFSIYLLILAISLGVTYFIRSKDYKTIIIVSATCGFIAYLFSITLGKTMGDYKLVLEYNFIKGVLLIVPLIAANIGFFYMLKNLNYMSSTQKAIVLIGVIFLCIFLLAYLTRDSLISGNFLINIKETPLNILGVLLIILITGYSIYQMKIETEKTIQNI